MNGTQILDAKYHYTACKLKTRLKEKQRVWVGDERELSAKTL
jgi:hypothetical protein